MFDQGMLVPLAILPLLTSLAISFLLTPLIIKLAPRLGIVDDPKRRNHPARLHEKPTPRGGGIPLFIAIIVSCLIFLPFDQRLSAILLGAAIVVGVGYLDDRRDYSPYIRLLAQILAAGVVVAAGIGISFISNPLGGIIDLSQPRIALNILGETRHIWVLSALFGFAWIVALMNAVSWSSGVDGQLSGFAGISALVIAILSLKFSADITQWPITILAVITAGAFFGFLPWHAYPQKIMPGFSGATLAGFMLAVLSLLSTTKVGTLMIVLAIPLADAGFSVARRVIAGKLTIWGDRKHLHHRLLDAGWSKPKIAAFYWLASAFLGILALYLNAEAKLYTIIGIVLFVGLLLIWLNYLLQSQKPQDHANG